MRTRREAEQRAEPLAVAAFALKAVALALGVAGIVLVALRLSTADQLVLLLSIGLVAIAIGTIIETVVLSRAIAELPGILETTIRQMQRGERGGRRRR